LAIHPGVGPLDESAVRETFLDAIGGGSGGERLMQLQWRDAGVLTVARVAPRPTPSGKILHLHHERGEASARSSAPRTARPD
jgi:hypothetical protein